MPDRPAHILLVGHCTPDGYAIRSAISSAISGATIEFARDQAHAESAATTADLLLVNRVLDGDYKDTDGIALIASLHALPGASARFMLVSNRPEAQVAAQSAGALPGFGKRDLYSPTTKALLIAALN